MAQPANPQPAATPKAAGLPKFVLLHGSLKRPGKAEGTFVNYHAGDVVEMSQADADSLPEGTLMPEAEFGEVLGTTVEKKLKAIKEERRSPEMKVKPDKQTEVLSTTAPAIKKGA